MEKGKRSRVANQRYKLNEGGLAHLFYSIHISPNSLAHSHISFIQNVRLISIGVLSLTLRAEGGRQAATCSESDAGGAAGGSPDPHGGTAHLVSEHVERLRDVVHVLGWDGAAARRLGRGRVRSTAGGCLVLLLVLLVGICSEG